MIISNEQALTHLHSGGLLLYPTETVYGLGCLPTNVDSIKKLQAIKPRRSGFIILIDEWEPYAHWIDEAFDRKKLERDKPTTWVFKSSDSAPHWLLSPEKEIAMRRVTYPPTLSLLQLLNEPIISTSANLPGHPTLQTIQELESVFDLPILEGEPGRKNPSQIIHHATGRIIRP